MSFQELLHELLGEDKGGSIGELRFCCPFCGETKYKFYVSDSLGSDNGLYHCKKCDESGNPITFVKKYFGVNGREAFDILERRGIELGRVDSFVMNNNELTDTEKMLMLFNRTNEVVEPDKHKEPPKLPIGVKLIKDNLENREVAPFLVYLHNRGITLKQIKEHNIGYITEGSCYKSDNKTLMKLTNSVVFFTFNTKGKCVYWNTRSIEKDPYIKSINAPNSNEQLGKGDVLFNLNRAMYQPIVVINEGVFDALTYLDYGIATFGKQVSNTQVDLLKNNLTIDTKIYIMLDSDACKENVWLAQNLMRHFKYVYLVPHGKEDANDLGTVEAFKLLKNNSILATPEGISTFQLRNSLTNIN